MTMFPIRLDFYLATSPGSVDAAFAGLDLPDLECGRELDLMKHSDEWPDAVLLLKERTAPSGGHSGDFPIALEFVHYPGRFAGNDDYMLAVKLALLVRLAVAFECRVLCDARDYVVREGKYARTESFLSQGGRVYGGAITPGEVESGRRPDEGWIPLEDIPSLYLNPDGTLRDREMAVERLRDWIANRDPTHLTNPALLFPATEAPTASEDDGNGNFREFPDGDEIEVDDAEWLAYTERLEAWEKGGGTTSSKQLISDGIGLPAPDSLDDGSVSEKLFEVIAGMERKHTYLYQTDHLSDRELYTWLWEEGLNGNIMDLSGIEGGACHTSPVGSGDEESVRISLIYYDSAEERAEWKAGWPEDEIPAHIDPPYDRDRFLPPRIDGPF